MQNVATGCVVTPGAGACLVAGWGRSGRGSAPGLVAETAFTTDRNRLKESVFSAVNPVFYGCAEIPFFPVAYSHP